MKPIVPDLSQNQTEISQGSSGVVEIPGHKSVPDKPGKSTKKKIPFLAGAVILIALGVIGLEVRSSRTQAVHHALQPAAELTVSVIHPRKAPITIPVLPAQTQAYTDAPIYALTRHGQGFTWPRSPGGAARNCSKGR
jgi:cell division septation protein DedD